MKCNNCHTKYSASRYQPLHGGSSAPGGFLFIGATLLIGSIVMFYLDVNIWKWVIGGISIFVLIIVPIAWSDCRGNGGYDDHGGVDCPKCSTTNTVYPWSL